MKRLTLVLMLGLTFAARAGTAKAEACEQGVDFGSEASIAAALKPPAAKSAEPCTPHIQLRGIRVAPAQPVAEKDAAAQTSESGHATVIPPLLFASGSAELQPAARQLLERIGRALASPDLKPYRFRIEGHTDTVGTAESNKDLSQRRAAAVVGYLLVQPGIDAGRLEAAGYGAERPIVKTPPGTDEPRNRRVQIVNLGG